MAKSKYIYMAVTGDKYELPIYVADSGSDLARHFGIQPDTVFAAIKMNRNGKKKGRKFVKVEIEEEKEE